MNTANLQLEGVYAVLAALFGALRDKGVCSDQEIDQLLAGVEKALASIRNGPPSCAAPTLTPSVSRPGY